MRRDIAPFVDSIIDSFIPGHIRESYPRLVEFVRAYLVYLEEVNTASFITNTLPEQRDIREQGEQFYDRLKAEIALFSPRSYVADPKIFLDHISNLYTTKGSEEAIKTFFRMFIDDEVEVQYPWEQVLIPSDGRWQVTTVLRVVLLEGDINDFLGKRVYQTSSEASAIVDSVSSKIYADATIYELKLIPSSIISVFSSQAEVAVDDENGDVLARAETYRSVSAMTVIAGGTGYKSGDKISVLGYPGSSWTAYVDVVGPNGEVKSIEMTNFGAGSTPLYIRETNPDNDTYYLLDFLTYRYTDNVRVGPNAPTVQVDTEAGTGLQINYVISPIASYKGRYDGIKGQLSEDIVLQDSYYFQKYSYEIKTAYSSNYWMNHLKKTIHPAGTEVFGNVTITEHLTNNITSSVFLIEKADPSEYVINDSPRLTITSIAFGGEADKEYILRTESYFADDYVDDIDGALFVDDQDVTSISTTSDSLDSINNPTPLP